MCSPFSRATEDGRAFLKVMPMAGWVSHSLFLIALTNRVQGPYSKLRTEFFP